MELPDTGVIRITPDVLVTPRTGVVGVEDEGALNQVVLSYTLRLQGVFFFYALLSQLSRWFYKGTYAYFSKLGNHFEVTIIAMVGWVLKDYLIVRYRYPDLDGTDAPYLNLQAGYTINYTMQRASTITGILLWLLILRVLKFVPQLLGSRLHLFPTPSRSPRGTSSPSSPPRPSSSGPSRASSTSRSARTCRSSPRCPTRSTRSCWASRPCGRRATGTARTPSRRSCSCSPSPPSARGCSPRWSSRS